MDLATKVCDVSNQLMGIKSSEEDPAQKYEIKRMQEVVCSDILSTSQCDADFDRLTQLASRVFNMPIVAISIVDQERQWFKSRIGLIDGQTHRNVAFCSYTVLEDSPKVMIVCDALEDKRFVNNGLVTGDPHIRFYAGAPLICRDVKLGSFCVIDREPHYDFDERKQQILIDLAESSVHLIWCKKQSLSSMDKEVAKIDSTVLSALKKPVENLSPLLNQISIDLDFSVRNEHLSPDDISAMFSHLSKFELQVSMLKKMTETSLQFGMSMASMESTLQLDIYPLMDCGITLEEFFAEIQHFSTVCYYQQGIEWILNIDEPRRGWKIACHASLHPQFLASVISYICLSYHITHNSVMIALSMSEEICCIPRDNYHNLVGHINDREWIATELSLSLNFSDLRQMHELDCCSYDTLNAFRFFEELIVSSGGELNKELINVTGEVTYKLRFHSVVTPETTNSLFTSRHSLISPLLRHSHSSLNQNLSQASKIALPECMSNLSELFRSSNETPMTHVSPVSTMSTAYPSSYPTFFRESVSLSSADANEETDSILVRKPWETGTSSTGESRHSTSSSSEHWLPSMEVLSNEMTLDTSSSKFFWQRHPTESSSSSPK